MNRPDPQKGREASGANPAHGMRDEPLLPVPSLTELYEQYGGTLLTYVHRRIGDVHASEDIVADVFVDVARSLPNYVDRGVPIRAWLLRIASNAVNRWRRRRRPWIGLKTEPAADSSGGSEGNDELRRAFLSLPARFQDVLALHHLEGCSTQEVALILGCREGTVRSRLVRGREKLKRSLERCGWHAAGEDQ